MIQKTIKTEKLQTLQELQRTEWLQIQCNGGGTVFFGLKLSTLNMGFRV